MSRLVVLFFHISLDAGWKKQQEEILAVSFFYKAPKN